MRDRDRAHDHSFFSDFLGERAPANLALCPTASGREHFILR